MFMPISFIQDFLICIEMLFAAIAHNLYYSFKVWYLCSMLMQCRRYVPVLVLFACGTARTDGRVVHAAMEYA